MRQLVDAARIGRFMTELGRASNAAARVYLTGGATAVLSGWRASTIDIDVRFEPEDDALLRAIAVLKESLEMNVELASPIDFIPVKQGWQDRSPFVARHGALFFHHFDPVAQALAKIERGHAQDLDDVTALIARGLVTPEALRAHFAAIEPDLYRYPAIDPASFRRAVNNVLRSLPE
jgi:uncharacterized nucleotidyltransferase DUF6036